MSTTQHTALSDGEIQENVANYAMRLREALSDLPHDVAEELIDGLEADLAEGCREHESPVENWLGDPVGYADELRRAAGLPPRADNAVEDATAGHADPNARGELAAALRDTLHRTRLAVSGQPAARAVINFALPLKPIWWIARAVGLWLSTAGWWSGRTLGDWVALAAMVIVSVNWGRGVWVPSWWRRGRGWHWISVALNLLLLIPLGNAVAMTLASAGPDLVVDQSSSQTPEPYEDVLFKQAQRAELERPSDATNLYVYDAAGQPVPNARILNEMGEPFSLQFNDDTARQSDLLETLVISPPYTTTDGIRIPSVYPRKLYNGFEGAVENQGPLPPSWSDKSYIGWPFPAIAPLPANNDPSYVPAAASPQP